MKIIDKDTNIFVIRFDNGEDVIAGLIDVCEQQHIRAGMFSVIGAAKHVVLSYYNLSTKTYQDTEIFKDVEIAGVTGNVAMMDGKIVVHCHGSFSDEKYHVQAGHVKKLIISATGEVVLTVSPFPIERAFDEKMGLNLMKG